MNPPTAPDAWSKLLESRVAKLEQVLQIKGTSIVLQFGQAKITIENNGIKLNCTGDISVNAKGHVETKAGTDNTISAGNCIETKAGLDVTISGGRNLQTKAGVNITITGGNSVVTKAPQILEN